MVINRIHLGSVVFARTLAASIAARQSAPVIASSAGRPPHPRPIDGADHVIESLHQRQRQTLLRGLTQRVPQRLMDLERPASFEILQG